MRWIEITIDTEHSKLRKLERRLLDLGVTGLITEDETDFNAFLGKNRKYWDYVDEDFAASMEGVSRVRFYVEDTREGRRDISRYGSALPGWELRTRQVRDEDWENNWKSYYKPIEVGEKLIIVPQWEEVPDTERTALRLDPGLIFGTGAHATTRMCLEALERYVTPGCGVLDLGCGSGILSIAALLLGAGHADGCDIDDKAPDVVMANAALNGIGGDRLSVRSGDVLSGNMYSGRRFHVVLSNIVADVVTALAETVPDLLDEGGVWICSGIIDGREDGTAQAIRRRGMTVAEHMRRDNWHGFVCTR